jgi:hypothetical protein
VHLAQRLYKGIFTMSTDIIQEGFCNHRFGKARALQTDKANRGFIRAQ